VTESRDDGPQDTTVSDPEDAAGFWEAHHRRREDGGTGANPVLVEVAGTLSPGIALDLGCGAGGDAIWLAEHGWRVTAVDISSTALRRLADRAQHLDHADRVVVERHDLARTFPDGRFDLVSVQYLHSPFDLPGPQVLRRAADALRPGARLLVVDHGSTAPWSWNPNPDAVFSSPLEVAANMQLDPAQWVIDRAEAVPRQAVGPNGKHADVIDHVLVLRRLAR
jgi:SAM-dependent methyltransferase